MKTIKFIGDPNNNGHGADEINFFGLMLTKGIARTCLDPEVLSKADTHTHFIVADVKTRTATKKAKAAEIKDDKNGE